MTHALAATGTDVYAGGEFVAAGGVGALRVAHWSGSTSQWSALGAGTDGEVSALTMLGSDIYAGGSFTRIGGVPANYIAKWNGSGWSALGAGMNAPVKALAVIGADLYAGGAFTTPTPLVAKWNGTAWVPLTASTDYSFGLPLGFVQVNALAVMGTDLYVGGTRLGFMGGVDTRDPATLARSNLAKYSTTNGSWSVVGSSITSNFVEALTVNGADLYVGGGIATAGGNPVTNIAKWNADTNTWSALGPGLNNRVWALATIGTDVYAGGIFGATGDNSVPLVRIAKWDGSAWSALGSGTSTLGTASVTSLAVRGTDLYVGGAFPTAGGLASPNIAKWDGSAWSTMGSGANGLVRALARDTSGRLFVGGLFGVAGTTVSPMIVKAVLDPPPTADAGADAFFAATSASGAVATLDASASSDPEGDALTYTWRDAASAIVGTTAIVSPTVPFGVHAYTLTVTDSHGNTASDSVVVTVEDVLTITVGTPPASGATYTFGQTVSASYTCADSAGILASCTGNVPNGTAVDTLSLGSQTFTVTASNARGDQSSVSTFYSVVQAASSTVVTCPASSTYSGVAQTPCAVSVTGPGGLSLAPAPAYANNTLAGTAAASYVFAGDANHTGSSASASFIITTAALSVTANNQVRADIGPDPVFDGTIVGAAPVDGITATYAVSPALLPGSYAIVPTLVDPNLRLGNYTVTITNGTLIVIDTQPPAITVPTVLTAEATSNDGARVVFDELVSAIDAASGPVDASCSPASGSTFPLRSSMVTCLAHDAAGNTASATFTVLVEDTTAPTLAGVDVTVTATSAAGIVVNYAPVGNDAVSGEVASVCSPTSGTTFAVGSTAVSCTATDAAGNLSATMIFHVVVLDGVAPVVTVPVIDPVEATSFAGAAVSYVVAADDDVDGTATPICAPISGASFALGTTTVSCSASDAAGNIGTATFSITVRDTTEPALTMPSLVTATLTSGSTTPVNYTATAADLVDGVLTPSCAPVSGSAFPIGNTTVQCSVGDQAGNVAAGSFTVTVNDGIAPVVTVSPAGDRVVEATSLNGAPVTFTATATDNHSAGVTAACAPLSGSQFPLGPTGVTCQAVDQNGNVGVASFTVTVVDTTAPLLMLPPAVTVTATSGSGAPLTFNASARDAVDGVRPVTCTPASGSTFPAGTTSVSCQASDTRGNTSSGGFVVTVTALQSGIDRFVAFSRDSTVLRAGATVISGDIGANERRRHAHRAENDDSEDGDNADVTVRLGQRAVMRQVTSRVVGDTVRLLNRAAVYDVVDNFLVNTGGTVFGQVTGTMAVPFVPMPGFPLVTPGTVPKDVPKNGTLTLGPGSYGAVHVANGGTLILSGGLYQMRSLDVDQGATVLFRGATEIRVKTELKTGAKGRLILDQSVPGLGASRIVIFVEGADASCAHNDADDDDDFGPASVHIGQSSIVQANIYAANGTVWLKAKTQATGAFIGDHVRIGQNVTLTLDSAFR